MKAECSEQVEQIHLEKSEVEQTVVELRNQLKSTEQELDDQKAANSRAPTQTIKNLVEKLKNQLAMKEKQNQVMTQFIVIGFINVIFMLFIVSPVWSLNSRPCMLTAVHFPPSFRMVLWVGFFCCVRKLCWSKIIYPNFCCKM